MNIFFLVASLAWDARIFDGKRGINAVQCSGSEPVYCSEKKFIGGHFDTGAQRYTTGMSPYSLVFKSSL